MRLPPSVQAEVDRVFKGAPDFLPTSFERVIVFRVEDHEVFMLPRVIGMRDESGHIFGAAVILQDVTRLRLLDEVKTNLVSTVSHELKTPLTSVRMGLHLLLEERIGPLNSKQTELLLAAREDSERLLRMINDLLDLAKLESGKAVLPSEVIEPRELVESAMEDLRAFVESRGSRLVTRIEPGLPKVFVDAQQIAHVFSNFVSNAVKHTKAGEEIVLGAKKQDEHRPFFGHRPRRRHSAAISCADLRPLLPRPRRGSDRRGSRSRDREGNRPRAGRHHRRQQHRRRRQRILFRSAAGQ